MTQEEFVALFGFPGTPAGDRMATALKELVDEACQETLTAEGLWLQDAYNNSDGKGYSWGIREGFRYAAMWVKGHAERGQSWRTNGAHQS